MRITYIDQRRGEIEQKKVEARWMARKFCLLLEKKQKIEKKKGKCPPLCTLAGGREREDRPRRALIDAMVLKEEKDRLKKGKGIVP